MRRSRPLAVVTSVVIAVMGLAGTAFSLTNDGGTSAASKSGRTSKQALALLDRYEADQATSDRAEAEFQAVVAEREKFLAGVAAEEQRRAEEAARAEQARRERAAAVAQRASRSAAAPAPARRSPAYGPWADLINRYPWPADTAYRVMMCESGGDANAYNPRSGATGLFQILDGPFDPAANIALAYDMWSSRGWQPWRACI